ncbi:DUF1643 domain-containing protein [Microbacter sp. GSS18]|nr:DUF1643 domain-containing protein [Microbacter sp. GSS18]
MWDPAPARANHRFALGRPANAGQSPGTLFVVGMNPSHANEVTSDTTVNLAIEASVELKCSGWVMLNLYPERASSPSNIGAFDQTLSDQNCAVIERVLRQHGATEVFAAWGDLKSAAVRKAKPHVLGVFAKLGVRPFYFDRLTVARQPRHLHSRGPKLDLQAPRHYL